MTPEELTSKTISYLARLDFLVESTILGLTALAPGPAGYVGATAALVFDVRSKYWIGVLLSALSMIPFYGYAPGGAKIAYNLTQINKTLTEVEMLLPGIRESRGLLATTKEHINKYNEKFPEALSKTPIKHRLQSIMDTQPVKT
jgi:hypothetical protein